MTNCTPYAVFYLTWGAETSLCMLTETSLGEGSGDPVNDRLRAVIRPSSYAGAKRRVNARTDFPYSGKLRLLHHPKQTKI